MRNAVKPTSLEASFKKYFFSKSLAIIGSKIIEVFPAPEVPTTKVDSYLRVSGILMTVEES